MNPYRPTPSGFVLEGNGFYWSSTLTGEPVTVTIGSVPVGKTVSEVRWHKANTPGTPYLTSTGPFTPSGDSVTFTLGTSTGPRMYYTAMTQPPSAANALAEWNSSQVRITYTDASTDSSVGEGEPQDAPVITSITPTGVQGGSWVKAEGTDWSVNLNDTAWQFTVYAPDETTATSWNTYREFHGVNGVCEGQVLVPTNAAKGVYTLKVTRTGDGATATRNFTVGDVDTGLISDIRDWFADGGGFWDGLADLFVPDFGALQASMETWRTAVTAKFPFSLIAAIQNLYMSQDDTTAYQTIAGATTMSFSFFGQTLNMERPYSDQWADFIRAFLRVIIYGAWILAIFHRVIPAVNA